MGGRGVCDAAPGGSCDAVVRSSMRNASSEKIAARVGEFCSGKEEEGVVLGETGEEKIENVRESELFT